MRRYGLREVNAGIKPSIKFDTIDCSDVVNVNWFLGSVLAHNGLDLESLQDIIRTFLSVNSINLRRITILKAAHY